MKNSQDKISKKLGEKKQIEERIFEDKKLKLRYNILSMIGEGCFGKIYLAMNRSQKRQCALKLEIIDRENTKISNLLMEIELLQRLRGISGVPKLYHAGKWDLGIYMEIQLLSSSLHCEKQKKFSDSEVRIIMCELLNILKCIHEKRVVHQDLKPQNIMRRSDGSLVIIDFGLSMIIDSHENNRKKGFIGTPRYASIAAHEGRQQKPKDDIESLLYVVGFLTQKKSPWYQLKSPSSERLERIYKMKQLTARSWLEDCGKEFSEAYEYLNSLTPNQKIDYGFLVNLFQQNKKSLTVKLKKEVRVNSRRHSDSRVFNMNVPVINIHFVKSELTAKEKQLEQNPSIDIRKQMSNYSQIAQDGYLQMIQLLTHQILPLRLENSNSENQQKQNIQSCSGTNEAELVPDLSKYRGIKFKNPFCI